MKITVVSYMARGERPSQGDCIFINGITYQENNMIFQNSIDLTHGLFVVCDGVSSEVGSSVLAKFICEQFNGHLFHKISKNYSDLLDKIHNLSLGTFINSEGAVFAGLLVKKSSYLIFNAGDVTIYEIKNNSVYQLTKKHTLAQQLVDNNMLSLHESHNHALKNYVTLGIGPGFSSLWKKEKCNICISNVSTHGKYLILSDGLDIDSKSVLSFFSDKNGSEHIDIYINYFNSMMHDDNASAIFISIK